MIKLTSNDDTVFELEEKVVPQGPPITADTLDNLGETSSQNNKFIPLDTPTNISGKMDGVTIRKVLLLMTLHFVHLMFGAYLIYYSFHFFNHSENWEKATKLNRETYGIYILNLSVIIIGLAIFGIFATYRKSAPLLYIYGGVMSLVMLGTVAFLEMDTPLHVQLKSAVEAGVQNGLRNYSDTASAEHLQFVQKLCECCGWNGPDDYKPILGLGRIPVSCCGKETFNQLGHARDTCMLKDIVYQTGCKTYPPKSKLSYFYFVYFFVELASLLSTYKLAYKICKKYDASVLP